jgi:hypothetical protein
MKRPSFPPSPTTSFSVSSRTARVTSKTPKGVADFLRTHDKMAALLPAAMRMASLQRDCAANLPAVFASCAILKFEADQLVLTAPNAALASKLKQQLPKLQESLIQLGWQVNAIRIKLQPGKIAEKSRNIKQLVLPSEAISSFVALSGALEDTPQNAALKSAIASMLKHHRGSR